LSRRETLNRFTPVLELATILSDGSSYLGWVGGTIDAALIARPYGCAIR
jgi:hypothetical protein